MGRWVVVEHNRDAEHARNDRRFVVVVRVPCVRLKKYGKKSISNSFSFSQSHSNSKFKSGRNEMK